MHSALRGNLTVYTVGLLFATHSSAQRRVQFNNDIQFELLILAVEHIPVCKWAERNSSSPWYQQFMADLLHIVIGVHF